MDTDVNQLAETCDRFWQVSVIAVPPYKLVHPWQLVGERAE
jgi:hypothetical protein